MSLQTINSTISGGGHVTAQHVVRALSFIDTVVAYVWMLLSALMVIAFILVWRTKHAPSRERVRRMAIGALLVLIAATWTFPIYANIGGDSLVNELYASYAYTAVYLLVLCIVFAASWRIALLIFPVLPWIVTAMVYATAQLRVRNS